MNRDTAPSRPTFLCHGPVIPPPRRRIVAIDGKPVRTLDDLLSCVESHKPGDRVTITVLRGGEKVQVPVTLEQARE
jgi:S1-C subfamily serine protease